MFLPPILGSYLCLLHLGKDKDFFHYIWENIHEISKNKAIFLLGMPPETGGKTGQIKSLEEYSGSPLL